jgi:exosortase/archaeosortase family protein
MRCSSRRYLPGAGGTAGPATMESCLPAWLHEGRSNAVSIGTISALRTASDWGHEARSRWDAFSVVAQTRVKVGVLVVTVGVAYRYSLESLLQTVGFDTPLAYVGLVPLISGALAVVRRHPVRPEPPIADRQLDYIIAVPLIAVAMAINLVLPGQQSVLFWVRRMDLISLPLFVAGVVALLFGTRVLWRQKFSVAYLFLAWPWPYSTILLGSLNGFTNITVDALTRMVKLLHLATPVSAANGESGLYQIVHHGVAFPVSVVTACSGVDGIVGFFLVGTAFSVLVAGPWVRKVLWLAAGLVLLWATNLGRLVLIFWVGQEWGEHLAINVLHPVAGLIIFNLGVLLMLLMLRPFGLRIGPTGPGQSGHGSGLAGTPGGGDGPRRPNVGPPVFLATGLLLVCSLILTVNQSTLKSFDLVASASGDPKLDSFLADPGHPPGWQAAYTTEYFQNKSLFGESSRWFRYTYTDIGGGNLSSTLPVTADVINSASVSDFGAYGVEACYNFHGYTLRDVAKVSLGGGIEGETLSYSTQSGGDWSIVYWIWPVITGTQTRYERVILYLQNSTAGEVKVPGNVSGINGLKGALSGTSSVDQRLTVNREFLVAFARETIKAQESIKEPADIDIAQVRPPVADEPVVRPRPVPRRARVKASTTTTSTVARQ